jgi:hypothetical protein
LKGLLSQTFEFRQRGGQVDNMVLDASGSPTFQAGEEVVLFLWTDGPSGAYQCIGFEQGVLRVSEQFGIKVVNRSIPVRNTVGAEPSTAGSTPVVRLEGTSLALREVLMQVSVALARAEASKSPQKEPR